MHPHPGPKNEDQSRGHKECVLGKEVGVDDVYTREPMSSLQTALSTKRTIDDEIGKPRDIKQRTADVNDHDDARISPPQRQSIQARNGTAEMQMAHRKGCSNEQCIMAFRIHGLLCDRPRTSTKNETSTKRTSGDPQVVSMHVDAVVPPGIVAQMQNVGLNTSMPLSLSPTIAKL